MRLYLRRIRENGEQRINESIMEAGATTGNWNREAFDRPPKTAASAV
jgi:hypothetical protein